MWVDLKHDLFFSDETLINLGTTEPAVHCLRAHPAACCLGGSTPCRWTQDMWRVHKSWGYPHCIIQLSWKDHDLVLTPMVTCGSLMTSNILELKTNWSWPVKIALGRHTWHQDTPYVQSQVRMPWGPDECDLHPRSLVWGPQMIANLVYNYKN